MFTNKKFIRAIAVFLLINFLFDIYLPTITYALTAGPTAPEATSFEPVDTTDMVNLISGDFTYNMPLLEVPGPSGGFPLSLSYHAGIMLDEEASWVGLGWTLNPGAITRNVNGFADDHYNVTTASRFFWEGGERHTLEVGVNGGVIGSKCLSAGLSIGYDTYQGFGVGSYFKFGLNFAGKVGYAGYNLTVGVDPWGNAYSSQGLGAGIGVSVKNVENLTGRLGISTNFESVSLNGSVDVKYSESESASLIDASISTGVYGASSSISVGGGQVHNSKTGNMSTSSWGFSLPIPFIDLGYNYQRYWVDEIENVETSGALHFVNVYGDIGYFDNHAYDAYSLLDPDMSGGIIENNEPEKVLGGSFPSYDDYNINAQGVAGKVKPYLFRKNLSRQNVKNGDKYDIINYQVGYDNYPVEFRFVNDFSNRYLYDPAGMVVDANSTTPIQFNFYSTDPVTGENGSDGYFDNHLAGSRHINYLTNHEIIYNSLSVSKYGFMDTKSSGFVRTLDDFRDNQIGAFVVTNETGVKYHFALPAYSYKEYQYSERIDKSEPLTFNEFKQPERYAYTWYLTAITGPDFVDRGIIGEFDEEDYGYWVEFDYGMWTDKYIWRNPGEGMKKDIDNKFQSFSEGWKEVYYLDAIKTKTHTAFFIKEIRDDAKSSILFLKDKILSHEFVTEENKEGSFETKELDNIYLSPVSPKLEYVSKPVSSLKLNKILLIENKNINPSYIDKTSGGSVGHPYYQETEVFKDGQSFELLVQHLPQNILDIHDINNSIISNALRVIEFNTNYSLVKETPNSFDSELADMEPPATSFPKSGKLTLNGVKFLGKGGADLMPPTNFNYDSEWEEYHVARREATERIYIQNSPYKAGDIIQDREGSFFCVLLSDNTDYHLVKYISGLAPGINEEIEVRKAKSIPYKKDAYDSWGMYKADFDNELISLNENIGRETTGISSRSADVWSLREVVTPLGAKIHIDYDGKKYRTSLFRKTPLYIKRLYTSGSNVLIELYNSISDENVEIINQQGTVNFSGIFRQTGEALSSSTRCHEEQDLHFLWDNYDKREVPVVSINNNFITINDPELFALITSSLGTQQCDCSEYDWVNDPVAGERFGTFVFDRPPKFAGGHILCNTDIKQYGGGLVTKSISVVNQNGKKSVTKYEYNNGYSSYSPVNFIDLTHLGYDDPTYEDYIATNFSNLQKKAFKSYYDSANVDFSDLLVNAREVPAPGVMHEYVTVKESVVQPDGSEYEIPNYSTYQFEVFNEGMVGFIKSPVDQIYGEQGIGDNIVFSAYNRRDTIKTRSLTLKNYSATAGNLKRITLYDKNGNKLSETINHFLHDRIYDDPIPDEDPEIQDGLERYMKFYEQDIATNFNSQGVVEETFLDARLIKQDYDFDQIVNPAFRMYHLLGILSKREEYPSVSIGQTNINYKTGVTTKTYNLKFDFYSGKVTEALAEDSYGNKYLTRETPAYHIYKNTYGTTVPGMGLALEGGYNMLTQSAATETFKINSDFVPFSGNAYTIQGLVSAGVQTWNNRWNYREYDESQGYVLQSSSTNKSIWRQQSGYQWRAPNQNEDGTGLFSDFVPFFEGGVSSPYWQKASEITLYDHYSHALEASDINGNFAATKMNVNDEVTIATVANARYTDFAFTGIEYDPVNNYLSSEVKLSDVTPVISTTAHTGYRSLGIDAAGEKACIFEVENPQQNTFYRTSVWTNSLNGRIVYAIDGVTHIADVTPSTTKKAGDWYLLDVTIPTDNSTGSLEIWCETTGGLALFDDFRVHPIDASMISYVYNEWGELSDILDANNIATHFEYDEMGRLKATYVESFKYGVVKTGEHKINYARNKQ